MIPKLLAAAAVPAVTVNLGGDPLSIEDWCTYIGELVAVAPKLHYTEQTHGSLVMDLTRMHQVIGRPTVDWHDGFRRMIRIRHPELTLKGWKAEQRSKDDRETRSSGFPAICDGLSSHTRQVPPRCSQAALDEAISIMARTQVRVLAEHRAAGRRHRRAITGADSREALLNAAEELFAQFGVGAVSIRSINAAAGLAQPSVHYHFRSKDRLLTAVLARQGDGVSRRVGELLSALEAQRRTPTVEELLTTIVTAYLELMRREPRTRGCDR
jgi:hypothetical protein